MSHISGIILAGGKSTRFGSNKAFAELHGQSFIQNTIITLKQSFSDVNIIANNPHIYRKCGITVHQDLIPDAGPLGGIHTALTYSSSHWICVVPCDMPLLSPALIDILIKNTSSEDAVLFTDQKKRIPFPIIINKTVKSKLAEYLNSGGRTVQKFLDICKLKTILFEQYYGYANFDMLTNFNTLSEYNKVKNKG